MSERFEIAVKVVSQAGNCVNEHKVGDRWVLGRLTPAGMCMSAFVALYPSVRTLMYGGSFPWETDPDATIVACPDSRNPVVFEVRRIRK